MQFQASSAAHESHASSTNNSAPTLSILLEHVQTLQIMVSYLMFHYAKFHKWMAEESCPKTPYALVPHPASIAELLYVPDFMAHADCV